MKLIGANRAAKVVGVDELPGKSNYFLGKDPKKWRTNVPTYAKVKYANVYPGVDVVYYGNQQQLEYDFVVSPGADPKAITLEIETGNTKLENRNPKVDANGDLVIATDAGEVRFRKPVVYQLVPNHESRTPGLDRHFLDGRYVLTARKEIRFEILNYDRARPLVIDPVLVYSTYLGGRGGEYAESIAGDSAGNTYVMGSTSSFAGNNPGFPSTAGAYQADNISAVDGFPMDGFVTKLNAAGSALVYSTYLGGALDDWGGGIAVDSAGSAYVTGFARGNFPITPNAYQGAPGGGYDVFVTKLNAAGSALVYSTFLGGSGDDSGAALLWTRRATSMSPAGPRPMISPPETLSRPNTAAVPV